MIRYPIPIPNNTPQLLAYTFKDQNKVIIDLTDYVSVTVEIKLQGMPYASVPAIFAAPKTNGVAMVASYTFISAGVWDIQFVCADASDNKLYGEILQFVCKPNVDDLALSQLPNY